MADKSKIEWTDATWNPIRGCSVVSEGCRNCYAMSVAARFSGKDQAYEGLAYRNESGAHWTGQVKLIEEHLEDPLRWKRPRRIFVNSMSDLFHESIPDEWIDRIFTVMALAPHDVFQILTKRPDRMCAYLLKKELEWTDWGVSEYADEIGFDFVFEKGELRQHLKSAGWWIDYDHDEDGGKDGWRTYYGGAIPLPNVWLGVSVEDQKTADERIPLLLQTPAAVRWISAEPLLGPINLSRWLSCADPHHRHTGPCSLYGSDQRLKWVVVGGESGPDARPMHPNWARSLRDQCVAAGVPFFFKQWGEWLPESEVKGYQVYGTFSHGTTSHRFSDNSTAYRMGKKAAGRLLDGREWNEYPSVSGHRSSVVTTAEASA